MRSLSEAAGLLAAQLRVGFGVTAAWDPPVLGRAARSIAGTPRVTESTLGGVAATIYLPRLGSGPWPAVVAFPGVTRQGRHHPALAGLGRGLASVGYVAFVAEPEGIAGGELTAATVQAALAATGAVMNRSDVVDPAVALVGVSGGATLALRVAAAPAFTACVTVVLGLAPVCDLTEAVRFATTGHRKEDGRLVPFETQDFFRLVCARSIVASLPESESREQLRAHLHSLPDYGLDPLGTLREVRDASLDTGARAALDLLLNQDPRKFDALLAALPVEVRGSLDALSTLTGAKAIEAPVELVVARRDKYVPFEDADAFAGACPTARLTVLDSLQHVVPRLAVGEARDLARLDGVLVRALAASYSH